MFARGGERSSRDHGVERPSSGRAATVHDARVAIHTVAKFHGRRHHPQRKLDIHIDARVAAHTWQIPRPPSAPRLARRARRYPDLLRVEDGIAACGSRCRCAGNATAPCEQVVCDAGWQGGDCAEQAEPTTWLAVIPDGRDDVILFIA